MSPEYALDGFFSEKSDVFSFGVVVLEIISGKRNTGFYQSDQTLSLLGYVSALYSFLICIDLMDILSYVYMSHETLAPPNFPRHGSYGKRTRCWS